MALAVSKQGCLAFLAVSAAIAGALTGSAQASVIEPSPSFPPLPFSFASPTGAGCFDIAAVCVTPGTFTLTSAVSTFLPAVQDISANATFTGSLTPLPPASGSLGTFTLSGTVDLSVLGRTSDAETGSWRSRDHGVIVDRPLVRPRHAVGDAGLLQPLERNHNDHAHGPNERIPKSLIRRVHGCDARDRATLPPLHATVGPIRSRRRRPSRRPGR